MLTDRALQHYGLTINLRPCAGGVLISVKTDCLAYRRLTLLAVAKKGLYDGRSAGEQAPEHQIDQEDSAIS